MKIFKFYYYLDTTLKKKKMSKQFKSNWGVRFYLNCKIVQQPSANQKLLFF